MKPQDVTLTPGETALFMVFGLAGGKKTLPRVKALCAELPALTRSMRNRFPEAQISCVMAFGARAWERLFSNAGQPKELAAFKEIKGKKHIAVSTPGDVFFHIRGKRPDACHDLAALVSGALDGVSTPVDEVQGFRYYDGRSIIGFVDGTENPENEERLAFACIGDEDPGFRGGSYVFVQKYLHDMKAWAGLSTEEQEKAIGRRKFDDRELGDGEKPDNAHNAVTNISDAEGNELKIVRANMPFAHPTKGEYGTYFVGYASSFATTRKMLENMFVGEPEGNTDRLLDFSVPVTGTLFFAPSADMLETLGE